MLTLSDNFVGGRGGTGKAYMVNLKSLSIIKCLKRLVYSFTFKAGIVLDSHISEVKN